MRDEAIVCHQPAGAPVLTFPDHLPVSARRADIEAALREHQVIVVCGETGSGKTTQLPKIALGLGRGGGLAWQPGSGRRPLIGHTQPRRIAARSVAERIAHAREEAERLRLHAAADLDSSMKRREAQAMDKIAQAEALALQEVKSLTVDLAIAASGRLIAENMDAAQSAKLVDAAIADLPRNLH